MIQRTFFRSLVFGARKWIAAISSLGLGLLPRSVIAQGVNYDESKIPVYTLPDPLVSAAGEKIESAEAWNGAQRERILELFREHVYGRSPGRPEGMKFEVLEENANALENRARAMKIKIVLGAEPDAPSFRLDLYLPNSNTPSPVFVGLNLFDRDDAHPQPGKIFEPDGKTPIPYPALPGEKLAEEIIGRGYGFATIHPSDFAPDDKAKFAEGVIGHYRKTGAMPEKNDAWKAISAWAWALSRALDYFETNPSVDAKRVIAIGHSRMGKTALWAAAQDNRFAAVISNESGCGGAALSKRVFGETVGGINRQFPHWFCENFQKYNERENDLPVDQHMLIALAAPRPVYVASALEDKWADPRGEFLSAQGADTVYRLLGLKGLGASEMPEANRSIGNEIAYHVRTGKHALTDFDWMFYLDFADRHFGKPVSSGDSKKKVTELFARENLVAWCIVPFDAKKRGPEARAEMLRRLGFTRFAYDWREEHIAQFDEEMEMLKRWGIKLEAFWFPGAMNREAEIILDLLRRHNIQTQLWVSMDFGGNSANADEQQEKIRKAAEAIHPIAQAAAKINCTVGLYNHGGWFGDPENQIAILDRLAMKNVGIVYNFHHGHDHLDRFPALLEKMRPHLLCLNLNGMTRDGEKLGKKIMPLAQGELDLDLLKMIEKSGYTGPIGILGHTMDDAEMTLRNNLDGLDWLVPQLNGAAPSKPKPIPREGKLSDADRSEVENQMIRASLPESHVIPAAKPHELTAASVQSPPFNHSSWPRSNGDSAATRYSTLDQVNRSNVKRLTHAWTYNSGDGRANIQCNPIIVNGTLYAPTAGDHVIALDGATGKEIWRFKPNGKPAHRGLIYWAGSMTDKPRILFNAGNDLWALDPRSGLPIDSFGQAGKVETGPVVVAGGIHENTLVIAGLNGDVWGHDVRDGKRLWSFRTIPRDAEFGADTWSAPEQGANCWGGLALDEARGIAYVATGSPKPNFTGGGHWGTNLFANCVLALDSKTGKRLWHFQEIRHDIWDLDLPASPVLITVNRDGKRVDAVAQVTKTGNTLLLDRLSGKPLFPIRMERAPPSKLPGERTWPYQPRVQLPEPFSRQIFSSDDATTRSADAHDYVMRGVNAANMGWYEPFEEGKPTIFYGIHGGAEWTGAAVDPATARLYVTANELPWIISVFSPDETPRDPNAPPTRGELVYRQHCAQCHGVDRIGAGMSPPLQGLARRMNDEQVAQLLETGRNSMPVATLTTDERTALLDFLFQRDLPANSNPAPKPAFPSFVSNGYPKLLDHEGYPGCKPPWGTLNCLDLNSGRLLWKKPLGEYPELAEQGLKNTGTENFGGAIVTAGGLVFCSGTPDLKLRAFDSDTGEELWSGQLPWGGYAPPATYEANGRQFVVIAATGGGKLGGEMGDAWVAFALTTESLANAD